MLETFYDYFGFVGALVISFLLFIFFIFWMAGVAGICMKKENDWTKTVRMTVAVLVPVYPFFWMIWDMIMQKIDIEGK